MGKGWGRLDFEGFLGGGEESMLSSVKGEKLKKFRPRSDVFKITSAVLRGISRRSRGRGTIQEEVKWSSPGETKLSRELKESRGGIKMVVILLPHLQLPRAAIVSKALKREGQRGPSLFPNAVSFILSEWRYMLPFVGKRECCIPTSPFRI